MKKRNVFIATLLLGPGAAQAIGLEEYLKMVEGNNRSIQAQDQLLQAAEIRYEQANLELSPVMTGGVSYLDDKGLNYNTSGVVTHQQVRGYNLGLAKKFSSGTSAAVNANLQTVNSQGTSSGVAFNNENHTGTLGVTLSQSLWKDFFGRATRLRWQREASLQAQEKTAYSLQKRQSLVDAEGLFWDHMYLKNELQIRKDGLERAKKIEGWVRARLNNGIGDKADELNAQGLVASRELQLIMTQDELTASEKKIADQVRAEKNSELPKLEGNIGSVRNLQTFVESADSKFSNISSGKVVRVDSYLASLDASAKQVAADEAKDKMRPDLVLAGQYKTNGYESTDADTIKRMTEKDHPVTGVSLTFTWLLDWDTKNAVRDTAAKEARAAALKKEQLEIEGQTAWSEINRRHQELTKKINAAEQISQIQTQRAAAERDKLSKGRSITSQVIIAEQDAAEAALTLTKMKAEQRKLESQARLFVKTEENK